MHDLRVPESELYKLGLEEFLDKEIERDKQVAITSIDGNPLLMYLAHRKGWMIRLENLTNEKELNKIKARGGDYLVVDKQQTSIEPPLPLLSEDEHFKLYKL